MAIFIQVKNRKLVKTFRFRLRGKQPCLTAFGMAVVVNLTFIKFLISGYLGTQSKGLDELPDIRRTASRKIKPLLYQGHRVSCASGARCVRLWKDDW